MELALKYDHISKAARELKIAKSTVSAWLRDAGKKTTTWKKYGKTYTEDEKKRAMELALKYDNASKAAKELGIHNKTLQGWVRKFRKSRK